MNKDCFAHHFALSFMCVFLLSRPCVFYRVTDLQNRVANQCVQMHGGWGYMWEYPICKAYVDARVQPIYGGSNEIMKELIARAIVHGN